MPTPICAVLPLTLDRLGSVKLPETEEPTKVRSLQEAFELFRPEIDIHVSVGEFGDEFRVRYALRSIHDFAPEGMCSRVEADENEWNDLVPLAAYIRSLERLRTMCVTKSVNDTVSDEPASALKSGVRQVFTAEQYRRSSAKALQSLVPRSPVHRSLRPERNLRLGAAGQMLNSSSSVIAELDLEINRAVQLRDTLLQAIFREIRRVEMAWHSLALFFKNCRSQNESTQFTPDLYLFNIDLVHLKSKDSVDLIEHFIANGQQNLNVQRNIAMLVVPEAVPRWLGERLEHLSEKFELMLISDVDFNTAAQHVRAISQQRQFTPDLAAPRAYMGTRLTLREPYWFESSSDERELRVSPSLGFAAVLCQHELTNDPRNERWKLPGLSATSVILEPTRDIGSTLSGSVWTLAPDGEDLVFQPQGSITAAMFLETWRIRSTISFLNRCLCLLASTVTFTRESLVRFEEELERILDSLTAARRIRRHDLFVDKNFRMIRDRKLTLRLMVLS